MRVVEEQFQALIAAFFGQRLEDVFAVGRGVARHGGIDLALGVDRHADRVGGNGDARLHHQAVLRHQLSLGREREIARAGIGQRAVGLLHLEEAVALNDQIERIVGLRESPLREDQLVGRRARAQAELQARRHDGLLSRRGSGLHHALVHQVLELGAARLVANGAGVGQVVGDVFHIGFLRPHSAGGAVECSNHSFSLFPTRPWRPVRWPAWTYRLQS